MKIQLYEQFARIGKAVGSPRRLELLEVLAQGERTVEVLASQTSLSVANASHHLQTLREAGLVETRRDGLYVYYRLAGPDVFELTRMIRSLGERRLAEVGRIVREYFLARDQMEPIGRDELVDRVQSGTVLVLDVRPTDEYRAGHIPGAISVPLDQIERRLKDLPPDREVVAYCRGPYCVLAFEAVEILRARGRRARRLVDGFPEWRAAGLPVDTLLSKR
ncbi:MAG: metalloregulator ArsR/SmtB family transcription factor [Candidatus Rokubacteria bacterium]|nr:metalloregulator ArsR/SmtB family transcription factor [Candidatus Rokubacteria bacterium]